MKDELRHSVSLTDYWCKNKYVIEPWFHTIYLEGGGGGGAPGAKLSLLWGPLINRYISGPSLIFKVAFCRFHHERGEISLAKLE